MIGSNFQRQLEQHNVWNKTQCLIFSEMGRSYDPEYLCSHVLNCVRPLMKKAVELWWQALLAESKVNDLVKKAQDLSRSQDNAENLRISLQNFHRQIGQKRSEAIELRRQTFELLNGELKHCRNFLNLLEPSYKYALEYIDVRRLRKIIRVAQHVERILVSFFENKINAVNKACKLFMQIKELSDRNSVLRADLKKLRLSADKASEEKVKQDICALKQQANAVKQSASDADMGVFNDLNDSHNQLLNIESDICSYFDVDPIYECLQSGEYDYLNEAYMPEWIGDEQIIREFFLREFRDKDFICRTLQYRRFKSTFEEKEGLELKFGAEELWNFLVLSGAGRLIKGKDGEDDRIEACIKDFQIAESYFVREAGRLLYRDGLPCIYLSCLWNHCQKVMISYGINSWDFFLKKCRSVFDYLKNASINSETKTYEAAVEGCEQNDKCSELVFYPLDGKCADTAAEDSLISGFDGSSAVLKFVKECGGIFTCQDAAERCWYLPEGAVKAFVRSLAGKDGLLIALGNDSFICIDSFCLDEDDRGRLFDIVDLCFEDLEFIDCSALAERAAEHGFYAPAEWLESFGREALKNLLRLALKDAFCVSYTGVVYRTNAGIEPNLSAAANIVKERDSVDIEELEEISRQSKAKSDKNEWLCLDDFYKVLVRVNERYFKADKFFNFDTAQIDKVIEEHMGDGCWLAFADADLLFDKLPVCNTLGLSWNRFMFESYLLRFSRSFSLVHYGSFKKKGAYGAAVRKEYFKKYGIKRKKRFEYTAAAFLAEAWEQWNDAEDRELQALLLLDKCGAISLLNGGLRDNTSANKTSFSGGRNFAYFIDLQYQMIARTIAIAEKIYNDNQEHIDF